MTRTNDLASRLQEVLLDGKWIANTNFQEQILSVNWKEATTSVGTLNSIAALTFHIKYYLKGLLQVLEGGPLDIRDKYSFDLPEIASEQDWQNLIEDFINYAKSFVKAVGNLNDDKLDAPFIEEKYGNYWRNIEGVVEHSYYHLGQVSLIKKMLKEVNE